MFSPNQFCSYLEVGSGDLAESDCTGLRLPISILLFSIQDSKIPNLDSRIELYSNSMIIAREFFFFRSFVA